MEVSTASTLPSKNATIKRLISRRTIPDLAATPADNVLDRAFEAERPNEKWVTDERP